MLITRGDSKRYKFKRTNAAKEVITVLPDKLFFTVKDRPDGKLAFQKSLGNGITYDSTTNYYYIDIRPEDTANLEFGDYGFDIEVTTDQIVQTICIGCLKVGIEFTGQEDKR